MAKHIHWLLELSAVLVSDVSWTYIFVVLTYIHTADFLHSLMGEATEYVFMCLV